MSLAPINPSTSVPVAAEVAKLAAPVPAPQVPASNLQPDTVSVSAAGRAASAAGDLDRDGDSH
jgi:hypothetical protein